MLNISKYFRISVTEKCNLSCFFCHNEGQSPEYNKHLSLDSLFFICKIANEEGFKKFKITGGEPTIRSDIVDIVKELSNLNINDLSIITNGTKLIEKAQDLKNAGLQRINVSLHTLNPIKFESSHNVKRDLLNMTIKGIDYALKIGYKDMKINFVYLGEESKEDLMDLIYFVKERSLLLVVLPVINYSTDKVTLDDLYQLFKDMGIAHEEPYLDDEGINKRILYLKNGAKVLLRIDELVNHIPYIFCKSCKTSELCREGIFPLRLSVDGKLIPCLANSEHQISVREFADNFDDDSIRNVFKEIRGWRNLE